MWKDINVIDCVYKDFFKKKGLKFVKLFINKCVCIVFVM